MNYREELNEYEKIVTDSGLSFSACDDERETENENAENSFAGKKSLTKAERKQLKKDARSLREQEKRERREERARRRAERRRKTEESTFLKIVLGIFIGVVLTITGLFLYRGYLTLDLPFGVVSLKMPYYDRMHNDKEDGKVDRVELNRKIDEMMTLVNKNYLYDVDENDIAEGIFNGLASGIAEKDKYAAYYPVENFVAEKQRLDGTYNGIGVTVQKDPVSGGILVISVSPNGPAAEAGIKPDDIIIGADGKDLTVMSITEATNGCIMGEAGTTVDLVVLRDGKTVEFTVERRKLDNVSVRAQLIPYKKIGYIGINAFNTNTEKEFIEAWDKLEVYEPKGMVIDLRNNGGGDMIRCLNMLDYIIKDNDGRYTGDSTFGNNRGRTLLLSIENKKGEKEYYFAHDGHESDIPVVVLTNENSASASEIFTGVLRSYGAKAVGTKTFGKGIVQGVYTLSDQSAFKFTTAQYVLPNDDKIHEIGIEPDVKVELEKIPVEVEDERFEKRSVHAWPDINNVLSTEIDINKDNQLKAAVEEIESLYQ